MYFEYFYSWDAHVLGLHPYFTIHCTSPLYSVLNSFALFLRTLLTFGLCCYVWNKESLSARRNSSFVKYSMCHKNSSHLMGKVMVVTSLNLHDPPIMVKPNGVNYYRDSVQYSVFSKAFIWLFYDIRKFLICVWTYVELQSFTFMHTYLHTYAIYACVGSIRKLWYER